MPPYPIESLGLRDGGNSLSQSLCNFGIDIPSRSPIAAIIPTLTLTFGDPWEINLPQSEGTDLWIKSWPLCPKMGQLCICFMLQNSGISPRIDLT